MLYLCSGVNKNDFDKILSSQYAKKSEDDLNKITYIEIENVEYLSAFCDDRFCGVFMIFKRDEIEWEIHSYLLKDAILHSRTFGMLAIKYCFSFGIDRLVAKIVESNTTAINFVKKLGFSLEGELKKRCRNNGRRMSVFIYSIVR